MKNQKIQVLQRSLKAPVSEIRDGVFQVKITDNIFHYVCLTFNEALELYKQYCVSSYNIDYYETLPGWSRDDFELMLNTLKTYTPQLLFKFPINYSLIELEFFENPKLAIYKLCGYDSQILDYHNKKYIAFCINDA